MQFNVRNQFNQANQQSRTARFGAHETMEAHEILTDAIDGINQYELYRPHVQDPQLAQLLDSQINFMIQEYNSLVSYLHNSGRIESTPYRAQSNFSPVLGLHNPSPENPNFNVNQLNDRDVASGMLGCAKASAVFSTLASLESSDPNLRNMMKNCTANKVDMAFDTFQYMNQKGYYQVPTMQDNTTQTVVNSYQPAHML